LLADAEFLLVVLLAHLESSGVQSDRRASERHVLKLRVPGSTASEAGVVVLIHDLSRTGLLIETSAALAVGADLEIDLPETGFRQAQVVWNSGHYFGCQFREPISRGGVSAALLKNPAQGHTSDAAAYDELWEDEEKFPLRTRAAIIIGLALASWAVVLALFALL
jgi:hypothetical protein